jgi:N-acetylmuramidase
MVVYIETEYVKTATHYQIWLNDRGANMAVDGKIGPATREATYAAFQNRNAAKITPEKEQRVARDLICSIRQLRTVAAVESAGSGWNADGLPAILWERHHFWQRTAGKFGVQWYSNPRPGDYTQDANRNGRNDSWEKLLLALGGLFGTGNPVTAFECASWGKFQVMGWQAQSLGYANALDMAFSLRDSEAGHYEMLKRFIRVNNLGPAMRAINGDPDRCRPFARGYNGAAYEKGRYHIKLAEAYRRLG